MNILFFEHPPFLGSQSMPRFAKMLARGMADRGFTVQRISPQPYLFRIPAPRIVRKWLGYFDQYIIFPIIVRRQVKKCPPDTLYVFTDHALGPWVPLVENRAHVIHCHDFLAQHSARKRIPANATSWLGRQYQAFIHRGYSQGKYFISVSEKTRDDLHSFLPEKPLLSEVVYNGVNPIFSPHDPTVARALLGKHCRLELGNGYLLHVGGNQWYKNRRGVIEIYNAWRSGQEKTWPLIMVGKKPNGELMNVYQASPYKNDIHLIENLPDELLPFAYSGATVFLFPSIAEGFGWPIAEAMASGCPVITTDSSPITEVAADAAFLIPVRPVDDKAKVDMWAWDASMVINKVINVDPLERVEIVDKGLLNARRFDSELALNRIAEIYESVCRLGMNETDKLIKQADEIFMNSQMNNN